MRPPSQCQSTWRTRVRMTGRPGYPNSAPRHLSWAPPLVPSEDPSAPSTPTSPPPTNQLAGSEGETGKEDLLETGGFTSFCYESGTHLFCGKPVLDDEGSCLRKHNSLCFPCRASSSLLRGWAVWLQLVFQTESVVLVSTCFAFVLRAYLRQILMQELMSRETVFTNSAVCVFPSSPSNGPTRELGVIGVKRRSQRGCYHECTCGREVTSV